MKLLIRPKLPFKLLGTSLQLDTETTYPAVPAKNIPGWFDKRMVFVGPDPGFLLEEGDYVIISGSFPKHP